MKTEKIGEVNFGKFKTEFSLTSSVKKYLKEEGVSIACLLPNGWEFYEVELFDFIDVDNDGEPDKKFGEDFEVIYFGIVEGRDLVNQDWDKEKKIIKEEGFSDKLDKNIKYLYDATTGFDKTPNNPNRKFDVKYIVRKKLK